MDTWNTSCGTLWNILASGTAAAGHFTLNVQEPLKCYRPKVRKVTPGSHALHHTLNNNLQQNKSHILGPLTSLGGIPVLHGSFLPQNGCLWAPGGLPPRFLPARFHQCTFS